MPIPKIRSKSFVYLPLCAVFLCTPDASATAGTTGGTAARPDSISTGAEPHIRLAQSELTPAERRERARRAETERQRRQSQQPALQRGSTSLQATAGQDELSRIKTALERMPALRTLRLTDLQKGQDAYRALLGTKALTVAIFPVGTAVQGRAGATQGDVRKPDGRLQRPPETIETRQQRQSVVPLTREELRERTRRAIEARRQQLQNAAPSVQEHRQEGAAHAVDGHQANLQHSRPAGFQAPAAARADLQQSHRPGLQTQAAADGKWNLAFSRGPFSFVELTRGRLGILDDVHLRSVSLVVAETDNEVAIADLPKALRPSLSPFANKQGVLPLKQGVNLFGEIDQFSGILQQFQQAFGVKRGPIRIAGSAGGDFIRHFADGNAASASTDIDDVRIGIDLPGISPPELRGVADSGPLNLRFHAAKGKIEGSGTTAVQIRLGDRSVTVDASVSFDDAPAIGHDFVSVSGRFPKPAEVLPRIPNLDVTGFGVDFGIARLGNGKSDARFDLGGAASFKRKPVKLAGKFVHEDGQKTFVELAISSDQLLFADLVPASVELPGLDAIKISEVRLRNDFLSVKARFRNEDTTVYIFESKARKTPNILVVHDEFRFSDYVPALKGTALDDIGRVENAMFLYVPKEGAAGAPGSLALADLPAPVLPKFMAGRGGAGARIDLKPGLNFFGHLDLKAPGAARTLLQEVGLDGAGHPALPLSGAVDPAILRPAQQQAKQIAIQVIESIDITAPLPELKVPRLPGGMDFRNAVFSLKGKKEPGQPDHPRVDVGIRGDIALAIGGTRLDLTGGLRVDKGVGSAAGTVKFAASAKHDWDRPFGLNWLSLKEIDLDADFEEHADRSKDLDFRIAATASINRKPPVKAEGELVVNAGKLEEIILRLAGLSFAELVPASVDLPGLDAIKISEVRLRNDFLSVKARFRNEDTTAYVFTPRGKRLPSILVVHDEFRFADYVPVLKGTPLDDMGRVENAMFLYVPKDGSADKGSSGSLTLSDLPAPVIPKFSMGQGGTGARIDLKPGFNFFGHLDLKAPGAVKTMLQKVGLDRLKDSRLPLSGAVDPAILRSAKEQAKQIAIQIIESIDIAAPLPELKLPRFPGGMDFKNAVLSLKGEKQPGQPDHPRVEIGIKGDVELAIHGTRLNLTGGLELDKEMGGAGMAVKFAAAAKHDWDHPLGLSWLSLKGLGISADFEESPDKSKGLDFKIDVAASINKKPPIKAEGELIVVGGKVQDVIFRLPGRVDVKDLPHIGSLPGVDQFAFSNLAISTRELAGDLTWKPKDITQKAAVYFGGVNRDQVALFYSLEKFSFGKLIPKLAGTEVGKIELPQFVLTLSTHDIVQTSIGQMPPEVQRILAGLSKDQTYRMDVAKGVGMFAPLDPRSVGGELKAALTKLKVHEPVVLGGAVGGVLSGAPHLDLKARMPRIPVPNDVPKFLSFAKDVGGTFYLSYGGEVLDLGVEADVDMVLGLADRKPKLVTLQLGVELGGSGGIGLRTTGSVKGTWHDAMGMIGLDLEEATFKFGIDADTAVEVGMKAKETIGGDRIDYDILVAAIPEALTPTKLAVAFDAQELGLDTYLAFGDVYLKTALAQPFFAALLEAALKKLGDKKAAASVDWYEQKIRSAPTLGELLPVNKLPTFHFKNVHVKLVMPGSGDPQLDLEPGVALAGQLWFGGKELGQVDTQLTFTGLKAAGDLALKEIGPLRIDRAKLDIDASLGLDPHFKILADTRLLGTQQNLEIIVERKGFRFDKVDDLGDLGKLTWAAKTVGTDLLHLTDFTIDGAFSSHFGEWLAAQVAAELRPGGKGLGQIASDVAAAQQVLEHIKALATARRNALKAAQLALDAVNKKVERLPAGERAVEFEKWLLGELSTAKDRVADAERALIKDSEILAYDAAYDAALNAQSSVTNMLGSFVVNSATVHGSLRDAAQGKPVRLHLDAAVSTHRIEIDADVPLARPRDLDIPKLIQAAYHTIKSDLFGKGK